jgi:hypothetical protein
MWVHRRNSNHELTSQDELFYNAGPRQHVPISLVLGPCTVISEPEFDAQMGLQTSPSAKDSPVDSLEYYISRTLFCSRAVDLKTGQFFDNINFEKVILKGEGLPESVFAIKKVCSLKSQGLCC